MKNKIKLCKIWIFNNFYKTLKIQNKTIILKNL